MPTGASSPERERVRVDLELQKAEAPYLGTTKEIGGEENPQVNQQHGVNASFTIYPSSDLVKHLPYLYLCFLICRTSVEAISLHC